uniref:Uncharacterized protein n=1 Tax=Arundo donax TaxID=35708 RepID=A0A0A9HNB5_ARUDO
MMLLKVPCRFIFGASQAIVKVCLFLASLCLGRDFYACFSYLRMGRSFCCPPCMGFVFGPSSSSVVVAEGVSCYHYGGVKDGDTGHFLPQSYPVM